jgi:hypothetical protein
MLQGLRCSSPSWSLHRPLRNLGLFAFRLGTIVVSQVVLSADAVGPACVLRQRRLPTEALVAFINGALVWPLACVNSAMPRQTRRI